MDKIEYLREYFKRPEVIEKRKATQEKRKIEKYIAFLKAHGYTVEREVRV